MARYRTKDETDLRWNRIRRQITRELDTQIASWREEQVNNLLSAAWDTYAKSLQTGDVFEVESDYVSEWVTKSLEESITIKPISNLLESN